MKKDQRKYKRFDTTLDASLKDEFNTVPVAVPVRNISKKGIGFSSKTQLRENSPVKLEITLPGELVPIFTEAEVKWCKPARQVWRKEHDIGVEFVRIDPFDCSRLLDYAYEKWLHTKQT